MAAGDLTTLALVKTYLGITGADKDAIINQLIPQISAAIATYCGRVFTPVTEHKGFIWSEGGKILYLQHVPVVRVIRIVDDTEDAIDIKYSNPAASGATVQVDQQAKKIYLNAFGTTESAEIDLTGKTLTQLKADIDSKPGWSATLWESGSKSAEELLSAANVEARRTAARFDILDDSLDDLELEPESGRLERRFGEFPIQRNVYAEYTAGYAPDAIPKDLEGLATTIVADAVRSASINQTLSEEKWPDYSYKTKSGETIDELLERYESQLSFWRRIKL